MIIILKLLLHLLAFYWLIFLQVPEWGAVKVEDIYNLLAEILHHSQQDNLHVITKIVAQAEKQIAASGS